MLLYRVLMTLLAPYFAVRILLDDAQSRAQRLGRGDGVVSGGMVLWLHAASNGEATAARPLIERLLAGDPGLTLIVTCNSRTGRDLVAGWGIPRVTARLAPLDYLLVVKHFVANWQPQALIIVENELWPNRIAEMANHQRTVLVLSARMSQKSARVWGRLPGLARAMMGKIAYLWPQDSGSAARFQALGLSAEKIGPQVNLKLAQPPKQPTPFTGFFRESTFLAASTHAGEDAPLLRGFHQALAANPDLRMILAPRHPRRSDEIQALLQREGLAFTTRSAGQDPAPDAPVYLADTLGEMAQWYSSAALTFVGGSLVPKGGHTPIEPTLYGSAVIHGPHLDNFADVYAALLGEKATQPIQSADDLARVLGNLDGPTCTAMADRAAQVVATLQTTGGLGPVVQKIGLLTGNSNLAT